jgi:hypothetical protein
MKNNAKPFWLFTLLCMIILPSTLSLSAETNSTMDKQICQLITQIRDIESLKCNIQNCYHTEKQILEVARPSGLSTSFSAKLDRELVNRVFGYLSNTPELESFVKAYTALLQRSNYREFFTSELFAEYMKLLQSGQARLISQLQRYFKSVSLVDSNEQQAPNVLPETPPWTQPSTVNIPRALNTVN